MSKYEQPEYTLVESVNGFEIRDYQEFYTSMVKEDRVRGYSGFGKLFNYISGQNDQAKPIAMTVPVLMSSEDETMEFVIPRSMGEFIPTPTNPEVLINKHPARRYLVKRFTGRATPEKIATIQEECLNHAKQKNVQLSKKTYLAQYSGPATPFFLRTNELLLEIINPA
jgi:hypothetical protein